MKAFGQPESQMEKLKVLLPGEVWSLGSAATLAISLGLLAGCATGTPEQRQDLAFPSEMDWRRPACMQPDFPSEMDWKRQAYAYWDYPAAWDYQWR